MRPRTKLIVGSVIAAVLVGAWSARFRVATGLVNRTLTQAHVPASYQITRIGPFLERLENVRIGDPAAPDLVARRVDVSLGYALSGPYIRAIDVDGARLAARLGPAGLSLGSIDRLMPTARRGGPVLPDIGVTLRDTTATVDTPYGTLRAVLAGSGNPAGSFTGNAKVSAAAVQVSPCRLSAISGDLRVTARSGAPTLAGPVRIGHVDCPGQMLAQGVANVTLSTDPTLQKLAIQSDIDGFGGRAGPVRFERVSAHVAAAGTLQTLNANADLTLHAAAVPDAAHMISSTSVSLAGTPIGPTSARAQAAIARLLGKADVSAKIGLAMRSGAFEVGLHRLAAVGDDGAKIVAVERGGMRWDAAGWRADADLTSGGGALPQLALALRQSKAGAPIDVTGTLSPYRVGDAALAASQIRLRWDKAGTRFNALASIDGPLGSGKVQGLTVPIAGRVSPSGALAIGEGCQQVSLHALQLSGYTFGPAQTQVCGAPIVARAAHGPVRIDATTSPVKLTGRTASGELATLAISRARISGTRFNVDQLDAVIGRPDRTTRLTVTSLDGSFASGTIRGGFQHTSANIANVPLDMTDANGTWAFVGGALQLDGALQVHDADPSPRFLPLNADHAVLRLADDKVTATADLQEPRTHALIAKVAIDHDLTLGSGHALLTVPGIRFAVKGLQPENLTPLTLGVVADVVGTISGEGRIAWGSGGVTSSGEFSTDKIDLAAAFGPVTGIKGTLRFTDLLGLVSAPNQQATIGEMNPGVIVDNGVVHYQLIGADRVGIEDATWPFAGGTLRLEPAVLNFGKDGERKLTFRVDGLDAAAFVQQLDFPNIAATGIFDGKLPMVFDDAGGRIEGGSIVARPAGGSIAYVGELSNAALGTMGKLAFDALKAIRYSSLDIGLDGRLDGEMVSRVRFTGVREATPDQNFVTRLIHNLPFHFNIEIRAPFRGLVGSARAYIDPKMLLSQLPVKKPSASKPAVQPSASGDKP
jgi:translocation and assembly module TamB